MEIWSIYIEFDISAIRLKCCVFADLRKRARMLENSIDVKLVTLNKLACGISGKSFIGFGIRVA